MGNLSAARQGTKRMISCFDMVNEFPVASGNAAIWQGGGVATDANGNLVKASDATAVKTAGIAKASVAASAAGSLKADQGIFYLTNGANALALASGHRFAPCYWEDDQTVGSASSTGIFAGYVVDIDAGGVWVLMGPSFSAGEAQDQKVYLTMRATDLLAADAVRYLLASPVAGKITKVRSILEGHAIAGADGTLTGKINGTGITGGVITHALAASAIGDKQVATPSAANVVAVGDTIEFLVGGGNTNGAAFADLVIEITTG